MNWAGGAAGIKSIVIMLSFIFLFIVAVLLDLQYLYLMSVTLAVLPLASYAIAYLFASRYSGERVHPATVQEGKRFPVTLHVQSGGGLPQAALSVAEELPEGLHRENLDAQPLSIMAPLDIWDGQTGERTYYLEAEKRGVYHFGATHVETTDPLGLFTFPAPLTIAPSEIVIHPQPLQSHALSVGGEGTYGLRERDGKTRRGEGMDFHGVREYRTGDALRRVHWPTTARTGKLAVVEFERAYQQDIVIGLDLMRGTNHGSGRDTTLEYAVKVAATLADRTLASGGGVTVITQFGRVVVKPREGDPDAARFHLFDLLARAQPEAEESLASALRAGQKNDRTHYAILTAQGDPRLSAFLTGRLSHGDTVQVYFFEPSSFGGPRSMSPAVAGGKLRVIEKQHSPWQSGGKNLEYLLRESD